MNIPGSKFVTFILKEVKIKKLHYVLTADDNTSRIDLCSTPNIPITPYYDISMKIGEKGKEDIISGQSMNPHGSKAVKFLLKEAKIEKLHDALTADSNISRTDPGSTSHQPVKPSRNIYLKRG